ncbi:MULTISPECIES: PhzF family phenazine biosynthesis protein [unclassified Sulfurospirillum]|uniref:PhzF family phenazine biosynthesis protein n=1 Tax=unclassified Sulfurospirillum TaxID=2618290 RepID=UPI0005016B08|nr:MULTISPECIES: PhzF family phenazine biosynthesis protein [unclassified Sulfurospirillum]KFL33174.1 phenazine biosynthesis protein PhzF [Sulfurospirillum sp. SCADC]
MTPTHLPIYIIDAFTDTLFKGNQAAVVPLEHWLPESTMQSIASENNLSETAFFVKNHEGVFEIRWFSPLKEIDFCGHATLASAYVIFNHLGHPFCITFWAKAVGRIEVNALENGLIEMSFPNREPECVGEVPEALKTGLSIAPLEFYKNQQAYFAVYKDEDDVKNVVPDLEKLTTLAPFDVVVTAPSVAFDFVSRYFWPANGGVEDPVTGSIHAGLAPFWSKRLGKQTLVALQSSKRSGVLYCCVEKERVFVSGACVEYLQGTIELRA